MLRSTPSGRPASDVGARRGRRHDSGVLDGLQAVVGVGCHLRLLLLWAGLSAEHGSAGSHAFLTGVHTASGAFVTNKAYSREFGKKTLFTTSAACKVKVDKALWVLWATTCGRVLAPDIDTVY